METQKNIAENQEKFIIHFDDKIAKTVPPHTRQQLAAAYLKLYAGFSYINWTNKHSLGRAWQTAFTQCESFIKTKNKKNPAAKYLNNVLGAHKKYWSRIIMTHPSRENTINPTDKKIQELRAIGTNMIRTAMDTINLILARYNEYIEEMTINQSNDNAKPQQNTQSVARAAAKPIEKQMPQQNIQPVARTVAKPVEKQVPQQNIQPVARAVAKPIEKTMVQQNNQKNIQKIPNIPEKRIEPKAELLKTAQKRVETNTKKHVELNAQQRAQIQQSFQQRLQIWKLNQFKQNAA